MGKWDGVEKVSAASTSNWLSIPTQSLSTSSTLQARQMRLPPLAAVALPTAFISPVVGQLLFQDPSAYRQEDRLHTSSVGSNAASPYKIAIIGAGASGTSAAYFLSKANEIINSRADGTRPVDVTVFEKEDGRVGGRTTVVYPYGDKERYEPVELGASIFADVNRNLNRAAKQFNLSTGAHLGEKDSTVGIWDGQQFLFEGLDDGWWNSARMLFRYGYSPLTTRNLVAKLVKRFLSLYDPAFLHSPSLSADSTLKKTESGFPWSSIEDLARALHFDDLAARDAKGWFYEKGVSELFVEEIIEAATRVNYGQNVDTLHAIGGGVSLAASGATGVREGNYRLFEEMLVRSGARIRFGSHGDVTGLIKFRDVEEAFAAGKISEDELRDHSFGEANGSRKADGAKWYLGTRSGFGALYDAVLIATPWRPSGISLINTDKAIEAPPYVHLHVTLIVTNASQPHYQYFGRGDQDAVPRSILTSYESMRRAKSLKPQQPLDDQKLQSSWSSTLLSPWKRKRTTLKHDLKLEFNSLTYLRALPPRNATVSSTSEHLVKIFSAERPSDELLDSLFTGPKAGGGPSSILWTLRHEWDAYPLLTPRTSFPPIEPDDNLLHLSALESLVSTMETSTVGARNAVGLLLQRWYGADFVHGGDGCEKWAPLTGKDSRSVDVKDEGDWAGWGCRSG